MTDPIADMLTRIRNGVNAKQAKIDMPASKLKAEIARILQDEGFIAGFKMVEAPAEREGKAPRQSMRLFLKYGPGGEKVISGIERVSRPGRRVYAGRDGVPPVRPAAGVYAQVRAVPFVFPRAGPDGRRRGRDQEQLVAK